jgi:ATP-dependent exoDNAse (exonuclease V) alpha subunit
VRADDDGIVVRTTAGIERALTGIDIAPGDRLLLTANRREGKLRTTNGELVTVSGVDSEGRIHLQDGRKLPADYRGFANGYAVTAHRSKGKTVDSVIISADGMRKELFYVAASRGERISRSLRATKSG